MEKLADLAHDEDPRVRLAAIVAAGNIPRPESMVVVLSAATQPRDKFIDTALTAATSALKPQWEPVLAKGAPDWKPEWRDLIKTLDKPKPKPAPAKKVAQQMGTPIVPIYGRIRVSPYTVGSISADVTAHGNAKHGDEVFHRRNSPASPAIASATKAATSAPRSTPSAARSRWTSSSAPCSNRKRK